MPPRLPFGYRHYSTQIPRDSFEAPPMPSGGRLGHQYRDMLKHQFDSILRHAIQMWGANYVRERAMFMVAESEK